jgi:hypothetical protein
MNLFIGFLVIVACLLLGGGMALFVAFLVRRFVDGE